MQQLKKSTKENIKAVQTNAETLFQDINSSSFNKIDQFVQYLADLRIVRGAIISLRELRYTDFALIESLESQALDIHVKLSNQCVQFLLKKDALQPYLERVFEAQSTIETIETARQGKTLEEKIESIAKELELLIEIVSNLKIEVTKDIHLEKIISS